MNGLPAQYTTIFHRVPCSKVTSLVSVVAFLRPCVSLEWCLAPLNGHGSLVLVLGGLDKSQRAGHALSVIFNLEYCEYKKGPQTGPSSGFQLPSHSILQSYINPILSLPSTPPTIPITTTCNIITVTKNYLKVNSLNFRCLKVIRTVIAKEKTSTCCNFYRFSMIHQEAIIQL